MTMHVQQTLPFLWQGGRQCSLQLLIQPWICAPGTHYSWVDQGSVEYEVCSTLPHMASTGNRTTDLLILSPMPYPLGHMLLKLTCFWGSVLMYRGLLVVSIELACTEVFSGKSFSDRSVKFDMTCDKHP